MITLHFNKLGRKFPKSIIGIRKSWLTSCELFHLPCICYLFWNILNHISLTNDRSCDNSPAVPHPGFTVAQQWDHLPSWSASQKQSSRHIISLTPQLPSHHTWLVIPATYRAGTQSSLQMRTLFKSIKGNINNYASTTGLHGDCMISYCISTCFCAHGYHQRQVSISSRLSHSHAS